MVRGKTHQTYRIWSKTDTWVFHPKKINSFKINTRLTHFYPFQRDFSGSPEKESLPLTHIHASEQLRSHLLRSALEQLWSGALLKRPISAALCTLFTAFKLVVNLRTQWPKSPPGQSHIFFLDQNITFTPLFAEVICQWNELKLCVSVQTDTDRDLQANRDRLVWGDNTAIDAQKMDSIKGEGEKMHDLKLKSVLPPQCSRAHYRPCVTACILTTHSLLKFNRLWEAAVSLQEVRVTVCLWLKALTHLNTLKAPL